MTNLRYESIWKLIEEYTFIIDLSSINEDPICIICNRILTDVYQSECGCKYCYKCINDYLSNEEKYCPGKKEECKEEYLVMEKCVIRNKMMNNKISKMKVQCPNESCELFEELSNIESHIRMCNKQKVECPYITLGCDGSRKTKDEVLAHLHDDNFDHAQLLVDYVENLMTEINTLKHNFKINENEIILLKNDSQLKEAHIKEQMKEIISLKSNVEKSLNNDIVHLKKVFEANKLRISSFKKELEKTKLQRDKQRNEINNLKVNFKKKEKKKMKIKENLKEIDLKISMLKVELEEKSKIIEILKGQMKALRNDVDMERDVRLMIKTGINNENLNIVNEDIMKRESVTEMMSEAIVGCVSRSLTEINEACHSSLGKINEESLEGVNILVVNNEVDLEKVNLMSKENENNNEKEFLSLVENDSTLRDKNVSLVESDINPEKENMSLCDNEVMLTNDTASLIESEFSLAKKRKYHGSIQSQVNEGISSCPNSNVDFVWKVVDISKKIKVTRNQRIFSNSFYSNGYKLCLYMRFSGDNIGLYCLIMKGVNDERLKWPMSLALSLSIEDQHSLIPFKTVTLRHSTSKPIDEAAFHKPKNDSNDRSIREYPFITYSSIKDSSSIIVNDTIVISCVLSET